MIRRKGNVYKLDTPATTLLLGTGGEQLYYGGRLAVGGCDYEFLRDESEENALRPFSAFGGEGPLGISCVLEGRAFFPRFVFRRAGLADKPALSPLPCSYSDSEEKNACQTLCFEFTDEPSKLKLFVYYTVFDDSDAIVLSSRLVNGGKKEISVNRPASLQLDVFGDGYGFVSFSDGFFEGKTQTPVPVGAMLVKETSAGFGAPFCDSFALLERPSRVYAAGLLYSGNARLAASADVYPRTRLRIGVNGAARETLASGEGLSSPEALMTFAEDEDSVRATVGAFFARHLLRGKWKDRERPALFFGENAAEGETLTKKIELAEGEALSEKMKFAAREALTKKIELAARSGAEIFVLDADVFAEREETEAEIAALVREKGMRFGVRLRPRTAPSSGGILEKRPEFALRGRNREIFGADGRTLLDFADERVQKYAVRALSALLSETKAVYMKWENEPSETEPSAQGACEGDPFRYAEGLYAVAEKLAERFPSLRTEGVADCGENGFFDFFLASGEGEPEKKFAFYKKYRKLLVRGTRYRLKDFSGRECGDIFVSENRFSAVAIVRGRETPRFTGREGISLRGLDAGTVYAVSVRKEGLFDETRRLTAAGELLMKGRIPLEKIAGEETFILLLEKAKRGKNV